jgi:NCS1 family nucleobase:cation symporter-1
LYRRRGTYTYLGGWNLRAVIATLMGCALAWSGPIQHRLGMSISFFDKLYSYAWFVGFGVAGLVYLLLMTLAPPRSNTESGVATEKAGA